MLNMEQHMMQRFNEAKKEFNFNYISRRYQDESVLKRKIMDLTETFSYYGGDSEAIVDFIGWLYDDCFK